MRGERMIEITTAPHQPSLKSMTCNIKLVGVLSSFFYCILCYLNTENINKDRSSSLEFYFWKKSIYIKLRKYFIIHGLEIPYFYCRTAVEFLYIIVRVCNYVINLTFLSLVMKF